VNALKGKKTTIKTHLTLFEQQIFHRKLCRPYLPPLLLECFGRLEDLLDSTWNDSPQVLQIAPLHSKGLPAAGLAISKATNVVPIQSRLYQQGDLFENLPLRVTRPEHTVEAEVIALLSVSGAPCVRLRKRRGDFKGCWSHALSYNKLSLCLRFIGCMLMLVCFCRDINFTIKCSKHQLLYMSVSLRRSLANESCHKVQAFGLLRSGYTRQCQT